MGRPKKTCPDNEKLIKLYCEEEMTGYEVAEYFDACTRKIYDWLDNLGIERRDKYKFEEGESNPNWSGGYEPDDEAQKFYSTKEWKNKRSEIIRRDNKQCTQCGGGENLEVHHLVPIKEDGRKLNEKNLITVCKSCHNYLHNNVYI
jgi:5-methylcytosine-specific restriction protein A